MCMKHNFYSVVGLNSYSDLSSPLAKIHGRVSWSGNASPSPPSPPALFLALIRILSSYMPCDASYGLNRSRSFFRKSKMVGKLVVHFDLTFFSVLTMSLGKIVFMLGA